MRRFAGPLLLAAAWALDCETENSPFGVSRFLDANGTTCGVGKYLCGDTREYAYCFEKWPSAEWSDPAHLRFEWTPDKDNTEVNVDGNCIRCTELSPNARRMKQLRVETETRQNTKEISIHLTEAKRQFGLALEVMRRQRGAGGSLNDLGLSQEDMRLVTFIEPYVNAAHNRTAPHRTPNRTATPNETESATSVAIVKAATRFDPPVDTKRWGPDSTGLPGAGQAVLLASRNTLAPPRLPRSR
jgi:hypothetical protein